MWKCYCQLAFFQVLLIKFNFYFSHNHLIHYMDISLDYVSKHVSKILSFDITCWSRLAVTWQNFKWSILLRVCQICNFMEKISRLWNEKNWTYFILIFHQKTFSGSCNFSCLYSNKIIFCLFSSAFDQKTGKKVAIKKLARPFQSAVHAKRTYRELRMLKHMNHENVSW